jgi:hypothetical protein
MTEQPAEATLTLSCQKCGRNIDVPLSLIQEAQALGRPLIFTHDVCPDDNDGAPLHRFRIFIKVTEVLSVDGNGDPTSEEDLTSMGATVEHRNFTMALPELSKRLGEQFAQIQAMSGVIDQALGTPKVIEPPTQAGSDDV